jgi:hypothetical protein
MDALGFPPEPDGDAAALLAEIPGRIGGPLEPAVAKFLGRSLHVVELRSPKDDVAPFITFNATQIADWSWETNTSEDLAGLIVFADDGGPDVYLLDPADRIGFGSTAVYSVGAGARDLDNLTLVAWSLADFLSIYADPASGARPANRWVRELRDEQTAADPPPLRLGDGTELPADAVTAPRFFPKVPVLRGVDLTRPLTIADVTYLPDPDRAGWLKLSDLRFFRSGRVAGGVVTGGSVGGFAVAAGSRVSWSPAGELIAFLPAEVTIVRGVPCRPGTAVLANGPTLLVTPHVDVEHGGFPCKAGCQIDDYGPGLGFRFTAARAFTFKGRTVPEDVAVGMTSDGGLRFDLIADFVLDGRILHAGTHVWYDADGAIREVYVPPGKR